MTGDSFDQTNFGFDLDGHQAFDQPGLGPAQVSRGYQVSGECATCGSRNLIPEIFQADGEHHSIVHCAFCGGMCS